MIFHNREDLRIVPFCAFNVIPEWYRDRIQKKFSITVEEWEEREGVELEDGLYRGLMRRGAGDENLNNNQQSETYVPGFTALYVDGIKYPVDGDGQLRLVYASSSFTEQKVGPLIGVFVYEINDNYVPQNLSNSTNS